VLSGLDLLVGQALRQIELMTGQAVPAEVLYAALD
jgi:shikimate 5-dehydrogenase